MINTGKCPKCEKLITSVKIEHIDINEVFQPRWHGVSLVCPMCSTILGVSIDPIAIKGDIIAEINRKLGS